MNHAAFSAAILAGGQATRFGGRDKSDLVVGGRTIRARQIAELSPLTDDILVIGRERDIIPDSGPLGGLHAALTEARHDRVLLLACDMPFVTAAFATYLVSLSADADIVVPRTERGYHPLCAVYARACLPAVTARLRERRLKMTELFDVAVTRMVTGDDIERFGDRHRLLANVNTPTEYADLEALQGHEL
jgi:molybdenum cofactor guanylyltransferase